MVECRTPVREVGGSILTQVAIVLQTCFLMTLLKEMYCTEFEHTSPILPMLKNRVILNNKVTVLKARAS